MTDRTILIVGGCGGIGLELARDLVDGGDRVIVTSRSQSTADAVAAELGERASGAAVDLSEPTEIAASLAGVGRLAATPAPGRQGDARSTPRLNPASAPERRGTLV